MNTETALEQVNRLVDEYRQRCLWFLSTDYYPSTPEQAVRVLQYIERRGDRHAFQRAAELKKWLLPSSSEPSVT